MAAAGGWLRASAGAATATILRDAAEAEAKIEADGGIPPGWNAEHCKEVMGDALDR